MLALAQYNAHYLLFLLGSWTKTPTLTHGFARVSFFYFCFTVLMVLILIRLTLLSVVILLKLHFLTVQNVLGCIKSFDLVIRSQLVCNQSPSNEQ